MALMQANLISQDYVRDVRNTNIIRYTIPSQDPDTVQLFELHSLGLSRGSIVIFRIDYPNDVLVNISIYNNKDAVLGTVDEIYRVIDIDQSYQEIELDSYFINKDEIEKDSLYIDVTNNSSDSTGMGTGEITIELGTYSFS